MAVCGARVFRVVLEITKKVSDGPGLVANGSLIPSHLPAAASIICRDLYELQGPPMSDRHHPEERL
jgi:hypothetical protein